MSSAIGWVVRWLPVAIFVVLIRTEAGTPGLTFVPGAENDLLVRKLGHAAVYGLLAILVHAATRVDEEAPRDQRLDMGDPAESARRRWMGFIRGWALPLAVVAVVATADELWQLSSVGREGKATDALTDLTGAIAALLLLRTRRYRRSARRGRRAAMAGRGPLES